MLSVSMIVGIIITGVCVARYLKHTRIMPDVESFIARMGLLVALVVVSLLQVIITLGNNVAVTLFSTLAIIYIGFCAIYDMIESYRRNKTNKIRAVKSILIG